uniref:Transthyretin-like protein 5 n=1 Tax=Acrobeloides nanus TaxID=290746 RepID=A0A914C6T0_9BILA
MYCAIVAVMILAVEVSATPDIFPSFEVGTVQSIAVEGELVCNGQPAVGVKVKLYDEDTGLDLDDLLMESVSDKKGRFYLKGYTTEISTIDPKLNIYHDCNDEKWPCLKKVSVVIPDSYITEGTKIPKKTFDVGTINLSGAFSGESRDCLNRK